MAVPRLRFGDERDVAIEDREQDDPPAVGGSGSLPDPAFRFEAVFTVGFPAVVT
jgi:hypothetical protein